MEKFNEEVSEYLKGKTVAIVGPASTALGTGKGEFIDSHDVVVRINKEFFAIPGREKDIGTRTDVLYSCLVPTQTAGGVRLLNKKFIHAQPWKAVVWAAFSKHLLTLNEPPDFYAYKNMANFCKRVDGKFPVGHIDPDVWVKAYWGSKGKPCTGTNAILDLLNRDVKSLYITGLSFFKTGYVPNYRRGLESARAAHKHIIRSSHSSGDNQFKYVCSVIDGDSRVVLDSFLKEAVAKEKEKV